MQDEVRGIRCWIRFNPSWRGVAVWGGGGRMQSNYEHLEGVGPGGGGDGVGGGGSPANEGQSVHQPRRNPRYTRMLHP